MADRILADPELFRPLLEIGMETPSEIGSRACWVVEFAFAKNPELLYPHLDYFTQNLGRVTPSSSIRPLARICELLTLSYYDGKGTPPPLSEHQREAMTAACFDWLIGDGKVAAQAYSMQALALLGSEFGWVHPELRAVVEARYQQGSPAYRARARQILKKLQ
jgi:hypothetical protein